MANKTIDGKVYDSTGAYLGHADMVYGTGPIGKQKNKGITTGLDSTATEKPQPSGMFNADKNRIDGADPRTPSTNPATRREKYNIGTSDVPESTRIGGYDTVAASMPKSYYPQAQQTTEDYLGAIKKLPGFSYYTTDLDNQLKEVERSLREQGIDTTKDIYGQYMTEAAQQMASINMQLGQLKAQENQITNTQASNAKLIYTLAKEVWSGLAQGQSIQQIAQNLGQEERVIQKIANNQTEELVQLNAEYEEEQLRGYLRNREDLDIDIARNIAQYNNLQKNLDYQFNSAMESLRRNEFDAKRAAQETSGIYGMTGTEYTLNRIQKQYDQQMGDIRNTYNYQSANAQMAINNALEDYSKNLKRRAEDYAQARKGIQGYALQSIMNIENNIGLSADQMAQALTTAYKNVTAAQSNAMSTYLEALDSGNSTLAQQIANAYGLTDLTTRQFTSQELGRTSTSTIGNDTNNLGHILASDDGVRIGTYKSPNGYTYNVYATREDGLLATQGLIERAYFGKTLKQAAQKWIGQGKDISGALAVMTELGLDPNAKLSAENVRKFMEAIGRREGTIKKGQTLEDRVKEGKQIEGGATTNVTDEELKAAKNIYDADMDMLTTVQRFEDSYSKIENILTQDINTIPGSIFSNVLKVQMKAQGIETVGDLFYHATNAESSFYDQATNLLRQLNNSDLNQAAKLLRQITNKTFISQLITAKGQGATFGNLTEGEGRRIETAYNEISGALDFESMMNGINFLMTNLANDLAYMNEIYGNNINPKTKYGEEDVIPQPITENDALDYIEETYGSGTIIQPL